MSRDTSRSAVYRVEDAVFGETLFTEPLGSTGVLALAGLLAGNDWWLTNGVPFDVVPTRRESHHSAASLTPGRGRRAQIRLSVHQEDAATLAHEAAHLLAGRHGETTPHGPVFRTADLDVVAVVCGQVAADRLARAFADERLDVAERPWPAPGPLDDRGLYGRWRLARQTTP